jgi:hypothetical protein
MPPNDNENGVDLRTIGGVGGAALPTIGLLEYLFSTLPKYRKLIQDAPDWSTVDGNVDLNKAMRTLRPGDFGVAGLQRSKDGPLVDFLINGSAGASGGPGAHGQMVGPYIQAPYKATNTPKGGKPPALPFLMNDRGELYNSSLARNRQKFIDEIAPNTEKYLTSYGNTQRYGILKERLRALSQQMQESGGTKNLRGERAQTVRELKRLLGSPSLRGFFEGTPQAQAKSTLARIQQLADQTTGDAATGQKARLLDLAQRFAGRGEAGGKSTQLAEEIKRTVDRVGTQGNLPRSTLFRPKAFETFVPTLHHGGIGGTAHDPLFHAFAALPESVQRDIAKRQGIGLRSLREQMANNTRQMVLDRRAAKKAPWKFNAGSSLGIDSVYDDLAKDRSALFPEGYYFNQPRGTIYARPADHVDEARLNKALQSRASTAYASSDAMGAGGKEVMGLNTIRRRFPFLQKLPFIGGAGIGAKSCWGDHCGSMPSAVLDEIGAVKPKLPHADVLPSTLLTDKNVKILGVTNKPLIMKQLMQSAGRRSFLGLGAAGLMGAAGYGLGAVGNALKASPAKPMPPQLDPHMFAQAQKLLQPRT